MRNFSVLIVEDEPGAAVNLQSVLQEVTPHTRIAGVAASIEETVEWLKSAPAPDLGFFDIQLEDGLSFEIFKKVNVEFPVIFTTAYDQYAIEAFKVNSIDYLLKPIKQSDLEVSIRKFEKLSWPNVSNHILEQLLQIPAKRTSTFLVHHKDKLIPLATSDVAFFHIEEGVVFARTFKNQHYPIEYTLEQLEEMLDRHEFFRANRQCIVNRKSIQEVGFYFNGRLSLVLQPMPAERVLISKIRVSIFKSWFTS